MQSIPRYFVLAGYMYHKTYVDTHFRVFLSENGVLESDFWGEYPGDDPERSCMGL